jgi:hypothetical protein
MTNENRHKKLCVSKKSTYRYSSTSPLTENSFLTLEISVADPDPGSVAFLTTGSGMGKK